MERYVISWYDHFTMILESEIIEAETELYALYEAFNRLTGKFPKEGQFTVPWIKALARAQDGAINAIAINDPEHVFVMHVINPLKDRATNEQVTKIPQYVH